MENRIKSLVATSLAHFANDGNGYIFVTIYPFIFTLSSYSFGTLKLASLFIIGVLVALENLFSVIASPVAGRVADKTRNYGGLLALGLVLMGIGILGYALTILFTSGSVLFLVLIPFTVIAGIGSAFYHPLGGSVLSETWPSGSIGRAMGINGSAGSAGRALYPLLVAALVVYLSAPSVIVLAFLSFVIGFFVLATLKQIGLGGAGKSEPLENVVQGLKPLPSKKNENANKKESSSVSLRATLRAILALTIVSFMKGIFSLGIVSFVPEYLQHVSGVSGVALGIAFSLTLTSPILGQPIFGYVADRFGRRLSLGLTTLGSGIAILLLLQTHNVYLQIIYLSLFGFFTFTQFPLLMPLATGAVPKEAGTLSNSIVWGLGNAGGGTVGPFLVGLLVTPAFLGSLNGAFLVVTLISLASLALLPFVHKVTKRG